MTGLDLVLLGGRAEKTGVVEVWVLYLGRCFSRREEDEKLVIDFDDDEGDRRETDVEEGEEEWRWGGANREERIGSLGGTIGGTSLQLTPPTVGEVENARRGVKATFAVGVLLC